MELAIVRIRKDVLYIGFFEIRCHFSNLSEPRAQYGMAKIALGFSQRGYTEIFCGFAAPEAAELRKYKPHPVAFFSTGAQLAQGLAVESRLRIQKSLNVEWI